MQYSIKEILDLKYGILFFKNHFIFVSFLRQKQCCNFPKHSIFFSDFRATVALLETRAACYKGSLKACCLIFFGRPQCDDHYNIGKKVLPKVAGFDKKKFHSLIFQNQIDN